MIAASQVLSAPPVSSPGNRFGPSIFQIWPMPVIVHEKNIDLPSGDSAPTPGARTSMSDSMRRDTSAGRGSGR